MTPSIRGLLAALGLLLVMSAQAGPKDDPHYNEVGFFDIHVCHWPDRPLFLMGLFSTVRFEEIAELRLAAPSGQDLGAFKPERYRYVQQLDGREKRVFITLFDIPAAREEGWYTLQVRLKGGRTIEARDRVELRTLPIASGLQPAPGSENLPQPPAELRWNAIPGAKFYQVFVKDAWEGGKTLYSSPLLTEPRLSVPEDLLQPGGRYLWQVHARNLNDDPVWGDFNHGSLTADVLFSVAE